ncbi:MAG: hemolysin III family protein [Deltaproteobacteria bacterium]|nr:hemolysin III family protein [Deltaproteobacteria bacterium]
MHDPETRVLLSKDGSVHVTDEVCNSSISSLGAVLSLVGIWFLISLAWKAGQTWKIPAFSIYGFGLFTMFVSSALHHGINGSPETNHLLRQLDYFTIFVMIAGTATPFCLILLKNSLGWFILGLVWTLAIAGIVFKALRPDAPRWLMTSLYIGMGWLGLLMIKPIYEALPWQGLFAFSLGGLFFTAGGVIYVLEKPNPFPGKFGFHEIWHCLVLGGAASHFYAIRLLV